MTLQVLEVHDRLGLKAAYVEPKDEPKPKGKSGKVTYTKWTHDLTKKRDWELVRTWDNNHRVEVRGAVTTMIKGDFVILPARDTGTIKYEVEDRDLTLRTVQLRWIGEE